MTRRGVMARLEGRWERRQAEIDALYATPLETVGVDVSVVIEAPRQRVWDFVTDPRSNARLSERFVRIVPVPGTPVVGVGRQYRHEMVDEAGHTVVSLVEVVEHDPPHRLAGTITGGSTTLSRITLDEVPEGCRYTLRTELQLPVGHRHVADARLQPALAATLAKVKAVIEADQARPGP